MRFAPEPNPPKFLTKHTEPLLIKICSLFFFCLQRPRIEHRTVIVSPHLVDWTHTHTHISSSNIQPNFIQQDLDLLLIANYSVITFPPLAQHTHWRLTFDELNIVKCGCHRNGTKYVTRISCLANRPIPMITRNKMSGQWRPDHQSPTRILQWSVMVVIVGHLVGSLNAVSRENVFLSR